MVRRTEAARRFLTIVWAFAKKDFRVLVSYRLTFLIGIVGTLYGIVQFKFVSRLIGDTHYFSSSAAYFRFVVIGVIVAALMRSAIVSTAGSARRDQIEGTLEVLASQPVSLMALGFGWAILPVLEEFVSALLSLVIAIPLGLNGVKPNWPAILLVLLLVAVLFISMGFIAAAAVLAIQQGGSVAGIASAVMAIVSGTAFPVAVLPHFLRLVSYASPLTYALRAARTAVENGGDSALLGEIGILAGLAVVMLPIGLSALTLAFNYARSRGSLARF